MGRSVLNGTVQVDIEYGPLVSQKKFHESKARFKGFSGPIGCGKSQALCQEAIRLSYLNPGRMGLLGAPTYPMLRDATQVTLFEILDKNDIPYDFNKAENQVVMKETRSKILFRSMDDPERLRGSNLAWFGIDELTYTSEDAWLRMQGRLRDPGATSLCGFAVWTPKGYDWVFERFIGEQHLGCETVIAKAFENRYLLDKVPDFYERLRDSYDERFYQQEVLGEYLNLHAGRVYQAFSRDDNVREVALNPNLPILWALDFNVDPMCSVVVQIHGDKICVLDEIVLGRATTEQACEELLSRFRKHAGGLIVYADASGRHMQTSGYSDITIIRDFLRQTEFADAKMKIPKSNPHVRERIQLMNGKLRSASEIVDLVIHPRCKELIKDFEQVSYKQGSTVVDKERDSKRTHLSDALGYLIWQECQPRLKIGEQGGRLF